REGGNRNPPSLKRLFGDFLAAQKVTRGPGPGRPRGWQVCRKPAPGPAGPDKRAPAAASASPPVSLDTALPAAYNKHRKRALRQAVGPKSVEVSYEEETVTCRGGGFCVLLQS